MRQTLRALTISAVVTMTLSVSGANGATSAESNIITVDTRGTGTLTVTGRVLNRVTGLGLSGVTVTLAGRSTTTSSSGSFSLANVDLAGGSTFQASASGFLSQTRTVSAPAGVLSVGVGDLSLEPSSTTVPVVESVTANPEGTYLGSVGANIGFSARVNWNGHAPGSVEWRANGGLMATSVGAGPVYEVPADIDNWFTPALRAEANTLSVVAKSSIGVASAPRSHNIAVVPLPPSLERVSGIVLPFTQFSNWQIGLDFSVPEPGFKKTVSLPILGTFGAEVSANGSFDYQLGSGDWEFSLGVGAETEVGKRGRRPNFPGLTRHPRLKLYLGNKEYSGLIAGMAEGVANASQGIVFQSFGGTAEFEGKFELGRFGPLDLFGPGSSTTLGKIPGLEAALRPISILIWLKLGLAGQAEWVLVPDVAFDSFEITGKLGLEASYEPDLKLAKLKLYAGGEPSATFGGPGDLFRQIGFKAYAGFEASTWVFEFSGKYVFVDYTYPSAGRRLPLTGVYDLGNGYLIEAAGNKTATWRPMERDYLAAGPEVFLPAAPGPGRRLSSAQVAAVAAQDVFARMGASSSPGAVYVPAAGPGRRISGDTNLPAQAELPLLENVFPESEPAMAGKGNELMLLYVRDTGATGNPAQFTEVAWTRFDGATWGPPTALAADSRGQFAPTVSFDGDGDAVAVWERIKDLGFNQTNDLSALAAQMEIVWSRRDMGSGTWTVPQALSDNTYLDHRPQLAGPLSDGDLLVAWTRNEANAMMGTGAAGSVSNSCVMAARWDSATAAWGTPAPLVTNLTGELSVSLAAAGDKAVYCWTRDVDGNLDDLSDSELFYRIFDGVSGLWGAAVRHTTDAVSDRNARVAVDGSGHAFPAWQRGTDLVIDKDFTGPPSPVRPDSTTMGFADFALTVGPGGNVLVLWQEMTDAGSDAHYRVYDPASATWGQDTLLSHDSELERDFAPVWDAMGNLTLAYNNVIVSNETMTVALEGGGTIDVPGVPQPGRVDLYAGKRAIVKDLTIGADGFMAEGNDFLPGDSTTLTATVKNSGNVAVENVAVSFYDGDPGASGTLIGGGTILGWLKAGDTQSVTSAWTVPSPAVARTLFAVVDPAGAVTEFDEGNNRQSVSVNGVDLDLSLLERTALRDGSLRVVAQVKNLGAPASPVSMLKIWDAGTTSNLLASVEVSVLSPGELVQIPLDLAAGTQPEGDRTYRLAVDDEGLSGDLDTRNNEVLFSVNLLIDDDGDGIPRSYEEANGMSDSDPADALADVDGDGFNGKQEYLAGTNPRDPNSALRLGQFNVVQNTTGDGMISTVSWASVESRLYRVERSFDLKQWDVVADDVDPTPPLNTISDEIVPKPTKVFYRIVVK